MTTVRQKRGGLKKRVTDFIKYVESKERVFAEKNKLGKTDLIELEMRTTRLLPALDEFCELTDEIRTDENAADEDAEVDAFEKSYFTILAKAKLLIEEASPSAVILPASAPTQTPIVNNNTGNTQIKLPTIHLPTFRGERTKFLEFRDIYEALIHNNSDISNIQKLHYLKSALEGEAKQIIQHIEIAATNYGIAWDLLCARYENKRLLIKNHLAELFNSKKIEKESSYKLRELVDSMNKHLGALKSMGEPVDEWDTMIVFVVESKFDEVTARDWEKVKPTSGHFPTRKDLLAFLTEKADMLDSLDSRDSESKPKFQTGQKYNLKVKNNTTMLNNISCHMAKDCQAFGCRKCKRKHNTLLHIGQKQTEKPDTSTMALAAQTHVSDFTLLPTAMVNVLDFRGNPQTCRVLLDSGSQSNFISAKAAKQLRLPIQPFQMRVSGVNNCSTDISGRCTATIKCDRTKFVAEIECLVLPTVSQALPQISLNVSEWKIPNNIKLADPCFENRDKIDLLLGAGIFSKVLLQNQINLGKDKPLLQNTMLGWIIFGPMPYRAALPANEIKCHFSTAKDDEIRNQLTRFWELEECSNVPVRSKDENECEEYFVKTHTRESDGRFSVSIPFGHATEELGNSVSGARDRFYSLERKLQANPELGTMYRKFIREYEALGHMSRIPNLSSWEGTQYVIPHHGVVNESSTTTKLRVVFDASFKTSSGVSRNDLERVGPLIQDDLIGILIRFRQHAIAITGDIEKMYRQVLIKPEERHLQRILFRANPSDVLGSYELNTVTYGTASASFLVIRALHQLAQENFVRYPDASAIISSDFYVDDLLTGAETVEDAKELCLQIRNILKQGCFPIRKWVSNNDSAISTVSSGSDKNAMEIGESGMTKILGLHWCPTTDSFSYKIKGEIAPRYTKRHILSAISRIFDPLGMLSPCVIRSKMLVQMLWQDKVGWDEAVSGGIKDKWSDFGEDLKKLNFIKIPRRVICNNPVNIQIHGFADASEKAYGACVYVRTINSTNVVTCNLLCAKSKVAPLKTSTIPRLELCAALLLAKLTRKVIAALRLNIDKVYLWSDSTIVLGWLKMQVNLLKIFVANRVVQICELVGEVTWRHVPTISNPADLISRGVTATTLLESHLWWHGPIWLLSNESTWPVGLREQQALPDLRQSTTALHCVQRERVIDPQRFSNLSRLRRAVAYCYRFMTNCRKIERERNKNPLSVDELNQAETQILKQMQTECLDVELNALRAKRALPLNSKIKNLLPFIDQNGLLRVSGRLQNAGLSYDQTHPIILPARHHVSKLIFQYEHLKTGHTGPQHLLCSIRERYWPVRGRDMARRAVHECVRCYRAKPTYGVPIMGAMPGSRVQQSFPFETTGVDYAGPFLIKNKKGRGAKISKSYLALFVCFSSKAVHIEVVSDLTTEAFIAALRRFIARRGKPKAIHSDNATNFVGTNNELRVIIRTLENDKACVQDMLAEEGIAWHFIPPQAPHFGGIWEAGIKSTKHNLKRILANASLTFEEFATVCCQIEAILNSRPLSNDPKDLDPLTPAHFLIGRKTTSILDPDLQHVPENRLTNFQKLQQLTQHFWNRWSKEYLPTLQPRQKWLTERKMLQVDQLIVIQEDNLPPLRWMLGRIIKVHRGKDNAVRVVTVRTQNGVLKRPVSKVFPLPLD